MQATLEAGSGEQPLESERPLTKISMALYGLPNLPTSIVGLPIAIYIPAFYAGDLGLSLAFVGVILTLSRLTDVITDPMIGILSDRGYKPISVKFGRKFRPFFNNFFFCHF